MLKEFREGGAPKEDDSKEIPFFKEPTPTVSVNITEYPFVENRKKKYSCTTLLGGNQWGYKKHTLFSQWKT